MAKLSQKKPKKERDRIGLILYLLYVFFLGLSIVFVVRIIGIQWFWEVDSDLKPYFLPSSIRSVIEPERGAIIGCDGQILALSTPMYQLYMDCTVRKDYFRKHDKADSLERAWKAKARVFAEVFAEEAGGNADEWYGQIEKGRQNGVKYLRLGGQIDRGSLDFKMEALLHAISIVTVFMILLLLARFITASAVNKMFKPLTEMGRKMNEASIENLEYIIYDRDDEVSQLVRAYNLMVHDLYDSTTQLTMSERDKAWATMARQVAHEIKNPLTPIKLQIQRLIRLKNNGNPVWMERFDAVSRDVLAQIDILTETANDFSTFAKLYMEEPVEINLDQLISDEVFLFDTKENIRFTYIGLKDALIIGPKPQLTRVLTNLIGNAIQAIEHKQQAEKEEGVPVSDGNIYISLRHSSKEGFYDIVIEDNRPGVSEENICRLFTPNFTTKNSGTGLGLAISRSVLERCAASIGYSSSFSLGGACFTIKYPKS